MEGGDNMNIETTTIENEAATYASEEIAQDLANFANRVGLNGDFAFEFEAVRIDAGWTVRCKRCGQFAT